MDVAGDMITVSCENHREELASGLWNFFQSSYAVDFVTQWGGRSILAHRLILDVFLSPDKLGPSLRGAQPEKPSGRDPDRHCSLASLVEFLYTGKVVIHKEQLGNLLLAARESEFKMLVEAVESVNATLTKEEQPDIKPVIVKQEEDDVIEIPPSKDDESDQIKIEPEVVDDREIDPSNEDYLFLHPQMDELCETDPMDSVPAAVHVDAEMMAAEPEDGSNDQNEAGVIGSCRIAAPPLAQPQPSPAALPNKVRNFKCIFCDRRFVQSRDLEKHTRVHTSERPFKCHLCPMAFAYRLSLRGHLRSHGMYSGETNLRPAPGENGIGQVPLHLGVRAENECDTTQPQPPVMADVVGNPFDRSAVNAYGSTCKVCNKSFSNWYRLKRHMLVHNGIKDYKCHLCSRAFAYKQSLQCHLRTHSETESGGFDRTPNSIGDRFIASTSGQKQFGGGSTSSGAGLALTSKKVHRCGFCGKVLSSRKSLHHHERIHVGYKPYKCFFCSKAFGRKDHRDIHSKTHQTERLPGTASPDDEPEIIFEKSSHVDLPEQPIAAPATSTTAADNPMEVLEQFVHSAPAPAAAKFGCGFCGKSLASISSLRQHERIHTGYKPYKCPYCDRAFTRKDHRDLHARSHTDERPFKCHLCQKSYRHATSLKEHMIWHTREENIAVGSGSHAAPAEIAIGESPVGQHPFQCLVCQKTFSTSWNLHVHARSHGGEKTFSRESEKAFRCSFCVLSFDSRSYLIRHMRIHTGEKPHKCPYCDKSFSRRGNMLTHTRIHGHQDQ